MSTQLTIGRGQGITQAIATQLGYNQQQLKQLDTNIWSQVLTEIKNDNNTKTKFKDAETQYNSGSKDGNGDFELGEAVVAASPKTPKLKVSDREIAGLPVTPQMWQDLPQGKQITRVVNGQPQTIEITKDQDGNKVRYLVNEDGTRGEKLVAVAKFGKNAYQTESRYLAEHKAQQEAPADIASTPPEERMYRTKNGEV